MNIETLKAEKEKIMKKADIEILKLELKYLKEQKKLDDELKKLKEEITAVSKAEAKKKPERKSILSKIFKVSIE